MIQVLDALYTQTHFSVSKNVVEIMHHTNFIIVQPQLHEVCDYGQIVDCFNPARSKSLVRTDFAQCLLT